MRLGGGVSTIRQYLLAGLVDEMDVAMSPVLLGSGENLFAGVDLAGLGYACIQRVPSPRVTHVIIAKQR